MNSWPYEAVGICAGATDSTGAGNCTGAGVQGLL